MNENRDLDLKLGDNTKEVMEAHVMAVCLHAEVLGWWRSCQTNDNSSLGSNAVEEMFGGRLNPLGHSGYEGFQ